ncbi:hypothetical protein VE03_07783 [Pseudogymnoascus sp. 23342-1-I1]|nr:hypothetical protein VE03_07783 [Pseudogymnoascus sp. 23342-1-I1]
MNNENKNSKAISPCNPETRFLGNRENKGSGTAEMHQKSTSNGKKHSTQQARKENKIQGWLSGVGAETLPRHPDEDSSHGGDNHSISNPTAPTEDRSISNPTASTEYRSLSNPAASTRSSAMVAVDVNDSDYRNSLSHRNIYIEFTEPPIKLIQRAREVIGRPRHYPKMNGSAAQELARKIRKLQNRDEDAVSKGLAPYIVPDISQIFEEKLERNSNQLWNRSIAIPILPDLLNAPPFLLLPRPKPDFVFGYSKLAFSTRQTSSILHLVEDELGHSYAIPDKITCFPFLTIEFKSQARKGTHYAATNQTAGAGAIALNGQLELLRRSCNATGLDADVPHFFSATIDQKYAQINVHWVGGNPEEGEPYSFNVEMVAMYFLDGVKGVRAVSQALENILDYSLEALLPSICVALEAYEAIIVTETETSAAVGDGGDGL